MQEEHVSETLLHFELWLCHESHKHEKRPLLMNSEPTDNIQVYMCVCVRARSESVFVANYLWSML